MKKINFYLGALAVASTALLSSCFSSDGGDDTPQAPEVTVNEIVTPCTIVPAANVDDVTFSTNGNTTKGSTVTITATANTAGKYTADSQTKTITIGDESTINVNFVFVLKAATVDATQEIGEDNSLTIFQGEKTENNTAVTTDKNQAATSIEIVNSNNAEDAVSVGQVAMEVSKEAVAQAQATAQSTNFSVVVVPANDDVKQVPATKDNIEEVAKEPVEVSTLQAICEPTGAVFTNPVKITIAVPNSEGIEFVAQLGDEKIERKATANELSVDVPHFSAWNFVLKARVENVRESQTYETKTVNVVPGNNTINYTSKLGWSVNRSNALVKTYLLGLLGSSRTVDVAKQANFNSTGNGRVTYRVIAKTVEFDVVSGTATFHVTANSGSTIEITNVEYNGHSGGNAQ